MKVNISVIGKFHLFDLARELYSRNLLGNIYTAYPEFKLKKENLPKEKIHTFPYVHTLYMTKISRMISAKSRKEWERYDALSFERFVSRNISECDVFVGISGSALKTGKKIQSMGGKYVCDRGSAHIRFQNEIMKQEYDIAGIYFDGIDPRVIDQEENEYLSADLITVPSGFNVDTFIRNGVPKEKIKKITYGVNLKKFFPIGVPDSKSFDVVFVGNISPNKGVHYLIDAFDKLVSNNKVLHLVGTANKDFLEKLKRKKNWKDKEIKLYGHVEQNHLKEILSRSHVMVHPSVQEGLAMVQAQAMACGCPVIATNHTGALDIFEDNKEGYIVSIRDSDAIAERLQRLADDRCLRDQMGSLALAKVKALGGWHDYGDSAVAAYRNLIKG